MRMGEWGQVSHSNLVFLSYSDVMVWVFISIDLLDFLYHFLSPTLLPLNTPSARIIFVVGRCQCHLPTTHQICHANEGLFMIWRIPTWPSSELELKDLKFASHWSRTLDILGKTMEKNSGRSHVSLWIASKFYSPPPPIVNLDRQTVKPFYKKDLKPQHKIHVKEKCLKNITFRGNIRCSIITDFNIWEQ